MGERSSTGRQNLEERKHVLRFVIIVFSMGMGFLEIASESALPLLVANNVLLDTIEQGLLQHPEQDWTAVPCSLGTRTTNVDHIRVHRSRLVIRVGSDLVLCLEIRGFRFAVAVAAALFDISGTLGLQFLEGLVAPIVVTDGLNMGRTGRDFTTAEKKRAVDQIPRLELPVTLDDPAVDPGAEENGRDKSHPNGNTNNGSSYLRPFEVNPAAATLPDNKHCILLVADRKGSGS